MADALDGEFYPVDVTDFAGTEETLSDAVDGLGGLHVVLTTAGGGVAEKTLGKDGPHALETFQFTVNLNLVASFNISRLAAAHMAKNEPEDPETTGERGVIINTASIAAFEGQIGQVAYTAAKAGIAGMCLTMARDLGSVGIRALAIAPSLFATGSDRRDPRRACRGIDQGRGVPEAPRPSGGVRPPGRSYRREPDAQRSVPATRRWTALRPQIDLFAKPAVA